MKQPHIRSSTRIFDVNIHSTTNCFTYFRRNLFSKAKEKIWWNIGRIQCVNSVRRRNVRSKHLKFLEKNVTDIKTHILMWTKCCEICKKPKLSLIVTSETSSSFGAVLSCVSGTFSRICSFIALRSGVWIWHWRVLSQDTLKLLYFGTLSEIWFG